MARTWYGKTDFALPANFSAENTEIKRTKDHFEYSVTLPDGAKLTLPVEAIIGGKRHGISFLERITAVDGIPLARPALIEGRYAYNAAHHELVISPGFALEKPHTYEDAVGNVLSDTFEKKCLACHGKPGTLGAGKEGGVHCESCHGPGFGHIAAVAKGKPREGVINPKRLSSDEQMEVCAQCHTGFTYQSDPMPDDMLVSNQVNALRHAECFVQSGHKLTCTGCHDPHEDSLRIVAKTRDTCLGCHSTAVARHAAICPVNQAGDCVGCHMPSIQKGSFHMTDHWIRVHPEQGVKAVKRDSALKSQVAPLWEFLRLIVVPDQEHANAAAGRLAAGDTFSKVARDLSADPTAPGGGYLGEMELTQMDANLAAAADQLRYGETSGIVNLGDRYVILNRQPRDFKSEANTLFNQATELKAQGDVKGAVEKDQQALAIYPYFLRAMIFFATTLGEAGDAGRAAELLRFAVQSYPKDASAEFNLGLTLASQPAEQIATFQRAIELDPDMVVAYENLGAALYMAGRPREAIQTFRTGLAIDPLSAKLNYNLGLALIEQGEKAAGEEYISVAAKTDPAAIPKKR